MAHHMTSFFERLFAENTTLTITKSNPSYKFFVSEYKNGLQRDQNGDLLINNEKERLMKLKRHICQIITRGTDAYSYYINEYRENSPVQDEQGNIILYDEIVEKQRKMWVVKSAYK